MVHRREELGDVQGEDGGVEAAVPVAGDEVHEDDAYVGGGVLADPSELSRVE